MERLKTMFTRILWYKFVFVKVIHFGGRRDSIFNLNNVLHHSRGLEDSNISKSLENFILVMFLTAQNVLGQFYVQWVVWTD